MTRMILAAILIAVASSAPADERDICIAFGNLLTAHVRASKDINAALVHSGTTTTIAAKTNPADSSASAANRAVIDLVGRINPHIDAMQDATEQAMDDLRRLCIP